MHAIYLLLLRLSLPSKECGNAKGSLNHSHLVMALSMASAARRTASKICNSLYIRNTNAAAGTRIMASYFAGHVQSTPPSPSPYPYKLNSINGVHQLYTMIAKRGMSCCSRLDVPPPRQVIVEYGEEEDNTDYFITLADAIEEAYPEVEVLGNPEDLQSRRGSFEVTIEGKVLFSKLEENRLPNIREILVAIDSLPLPCREEACSTS